MAHSTPANSPSPNAAASDIPWTFPDGEVVGVLKSPWASNHTAPMSASRADPRNEPMATEWSPPSTSGVSSSVNALATSSVS